MQNQFRLAKPVLKIHNQGRNVRVWRNRDTVWRRLAYLHMRSIAAVNSQGQHFARLYS